MQATGSISKGKLATKHNLRTCYDARNCPPNIDLSRSAENEVLVSRDIADVYAETFGEALAAYNAAQVEKRHPERQIPDYLEHVRKDKKLNEAYEFVVQVGNIDERPPEALCAAILRDFEREFEQAYGEHFKVIQAVVHMDEATPHMHMQVVPVAESKRGLAVQNSLNKAIEQAGMSDYKVMLLLWDETLTECMAAHDVERVAGDRERQRGGVDIDTYRRTMKLDGWAEEIVEQAEQEVAAKRAELSEVNRQIEQANERLESVRQREREAENQNRKLGERVSELKERLALEKAQPPRQSVAESVGTLIGHRGDGEREESLRVEVEELRGRVGGLELEVAAKRDKLWELDGRARSTRAAIERLRERLDVGIARVKAALAKISVVPHRCHNETKAIAREMGKNVQPDPYSTPREVWPMEQSRTTSRSYSRGRGR